MGNFLGRGHRREQKKASALPEAKNVEKKQDAVKEEQNKPRAPATTGSPKQKHGRPRGSGPSTVTPSSPNSNLPLKEKKTAVEDGPKTPLPPPQIVRSALVQPPQHQPVGLAPPVYPPPLYYPAYPPRTHLQEYQLAMMRNQQQYQQILQNYHQPMQQGMNLGAYSLPSPSPPPYTGQQFSPLAASAMLPSYYPSHISAWSPPGATGKMPNVNGAQQNTAFMSVATSSPAAAASSATAKTAASKAGRGKSSTKTATTTSGTESQHNGAKKKRKQIESKGASAAQVSSKKAKPTVSPTRQGGGRGRRQVSAKRQTRQRQRNDYGTSL